MHFLRQSERFTSSRSADMTCKGCLDRQRKLVKWLCKKPDSLLCRKAKARLKKMQDATEVKQ